MLNHSRNREPLRRGTGAIALLTMTAVAAPLAALTLTERVETRVGDANASDVTLVAGPAATSAAPGAPAPSSRRTPARGAAALATPPMVAEAAAAQQSGPASLSGTLADASGAVLPGVSIRVNDATGATRRTAVTDGAGRFTIQDLAPGAYEFVASLPGFATILNQVTLAPGENAQLRLNMRIGMVEETIRVGCAAGGAGLTPDANTLAERLVTLRESARALAQLVRQSALPVVEAQALPIRVGGQIKAPRKVRDMAPVCPRLLLPSLTTTVHLEATIGADGATRDIRLTGAPGNAPPQEFVDSATEAVQQWQFTPTLLNNVPVPVIMSVTVEYRRM